MEESGRADEATQPPVLLDGEDVHDWSKDDDDATEEAAICAVSTVAKAETADPTLLASSAHGLLSPLILATFIGSSLNLFERIALFFFEVYTFFVCIVY
ncbi:hypothetical protein AXF42_Ash021517 [Apostasia shenzhenica]|uniref:Uncharacterized protein n=1 Tax=Apostasia shenzhenica TaxID=1088818 RepID=A0A2H9ZYM6_9ASPA|nr:hypothetical protein AXF42_Ash021517 [Apostasia shenzhenica]